VCAPGTRSSVGTCELGHRGNHNPEGVNERVSETITDRENLRRAVELGQGIKVDPLTMPTPVVGKLLYFHKITELLYFRYW
jgi:hypothetical protein